MMTTRSTSERGLRKIKETLEGYQVPYHVTHILNTQTTQEVEDILRIGNSEMGMMLIITLGEEAHQMVNASRIPSLNAVVACLDKKPYEAWAGLTLLPDQAYVLGAENAGRFAAQVLSARNPGIRNALGAAIAAKEAELNAAGDRIHQETQYLGR